MDFIGKSRVALRLCVHSKYLKINKQNKHSSCCSSSTYALYKQLVNFMRILTLAIRRFHIEFIHSLKSVKRNLSLLLSYPKTRVNKNFSTALTHLRQ